MKNSTDIISNSAQILADWIQQSKKIVVLTGAGISTESGIADYRSKGGLWERFQPVMFQEFLSSKEKRIEYWTSKMDLYESFKEARPNAGHDAIAELDKRKKIKGVITQNIDGLHQLSGIPSPKILELHGTNRETICLECGNNEPWTKVYERLKRGDLSPTCESCGGLLKPNTISFGQSLDENVLQESISWSKDCDLFLAIGSTLVVEPAASLPRMAKHKGAKLVIITLSPTPLDEICDLKVTAQIGEFLSEVVTLNIL